ncbi:MAG: type IV secretion system protein [Alphaproteobacteria bacterium]|nr:type IV secretion system protein [Alphaproteobacteria bacterium]MBV9371312.1 type IV secretion system protein [Alphaproteobacteria bacterium]MBV9901776.1 type IV secretion system protein [Alphaproteobacteria bacterium]
MACPSFAPEGNFLSSLLLAVDCHARTIGAAGYQALSAPGSIASLLLTGMLTLFVAMFGYRMLFGQIPDARDGVVAVAKVGVVLALATSWPAFRTLAYDVTMSGPAELAANIGMPAGLPGSDGGVIARLQGVDDELAELNWRGVGRPPEVVEQAGPTEGLTPAQVAAEQARLRDLQDRPRWNPAQDAKMLAQARTLYLTGAIAGFASVRIVAGLLLALGPLFALFLLFDGTRGLFEGWIRGVAGAALGALATAIVLGVELALLEPWLAVILTQRRSNIATPTVPIELLAANLVFVLVLIAALVATARVARGFRLPEALRIAPARLAQALQPAAVPVVAAVAGAAGPRTERIDERPRAAALAEAVVATQRRENASPPPPAARLGAQRVGDAVAARGRSEERVPDAAPLGQSYRRRTRGRVSAGAGRRDRTA